MIYYGLYKITNLLNGKSFSPETNSNTSTSIEGGSFDTDVTGYCAPGRTCSWDEDAGMWKVA